MVLGLVLVGTGLVVTRTQYGRDKLRDWVQGLVASRINGTVHIGAVHGGLLTGLTIDTVAIRGADDSLFFSSGPISLRYDPRDLLDRRILLHDVRAEHPWVHIKELEGDPGWNYKRIFVSKPKGPELPRGRGFGDFIVIDTAQVRDATFLLTLKWHPADSLRGAKRDSAIREHLARPGKTFWRAADGYKHTYRWTDIDALLPRLRLADPDSAGRLFTVASLGVVEEDPPFHFRNARGVVRQQGDSIWLDLAHFDLPGSTGRARGKVTWGSHLPIRYDLRVWGDSVSMADVAWVYPTLPRTGGGRMVLDIRNDPRNLSVLDYRLKQVDLRTTGSHLRGDMTFAIGGPVLAVKDVDVRLDPMDFRFLHQLNGKPLPVDWQGTLTGTVRARGGPVNRFVVDDADITFRDRHVAGATSSFSGRGGLDILFPAYTVFRDFTVNARTVDLRSIQYLYPVFPPLGGTVSGVVTLDSVWTDVRFSDADISHRNGPEDPSRFTGAGRITYGELMRYDLDVQAQPLSLPMMRRAYPNLPLDGYVSGPIRATGTLEDLQVVATLSGAAGTLHYEGLLDINEPLWRVRGSGTMAAFDAKPAFTFASAPATSLNGRFDVDLGFTWAGTVPDSLTRIEGTASVALDRSMLDGLRVDPSFARLRFDGDRLGVDTLFLDTQGARIYAAGALGMWSQRVDSLGFRVVVDSLGGLRRYLARRGVPGTGPVVDSLAGNLALIGVARGRLDDLAIRATLLGNDLRLRDSGADTLVGRVDLRGLPSAPVGDLTVRVDRALAAGMRLDSAIARVALTDPGHGRVSLGAWSPTGPRATLGAAVERGTERTVLRLDTLSLRADSARWALAGPAVVTLDSAGGLAIDGLEVRDDARGRLMVQGSVPAAGAVALDVIADSLALRDLATFAQLPKRASGTLVARLQLRGTRDDPTVGLSAALVDARYGDAHLDRLDALASYADSNAHTTLSFVSGGKEALRAELDLPVALRRFEVTLPADSLRGSIVAESADLAVIEAFAPGVEEAKGTLNARVGLGGTWKAPTLGGAINISGAEAYLRPIGIRLRDGVANVRLVPGRDSIIVERIRAASGTGTIAITGALDYNDRGDPGFSLRLDARDFRAIDRSAIARLDISTGDEGVQLGGRLHGSTLAGVVVVDRGSIYIPETANKNLVELTGEDLEGIVDSTEARMRGLVPAAPSTLVQNIRLGGVRVAMGDDVWLRSAEANVKLGGSLNVTTAVDTVERVRGIYGRRQGRDTLAYRLALEGTLTANRGTYTLSVGPVQREFTVERGSITYEGTPDLNPRLDIAAMYTVRQASARDVPIRARLTGYLYPAPMLTLESADAFPLSQSDLISYLVTGSPSFDIAQRTSDYTQTGLSLLLPSLGTRLGQELRKQFPWVDQLTLETGAADVSAGTPVTSEVQRALLNSRLGAEKQISDRLFASLSAGLCAFDQAQSNVSFADALGAQLEYRFTPLFSAEVGLEPSSTALQCGRPIRGLPPSPQQLTFSLSRTWRF
ncbi:MAG TPA: translocation/assembly module TamB domain-containing protein [Gemmatimonadaceae bacterium]